MRLVMHGRRRLGWTLVVIVVASTACGGSLSQGFDPLAEYGKYGDSERLIEPTSYVEYLKATRFQNGELDSLPPFAVILHDNRVPRFLDSLGIRPTEYRTIDLGETDPSLIWVVGAADQRPAFIVARGMPGAGGVATQAAELGALGVRVLVHVGTCGILGPMIPGDQLILSNGSLKDGGAVLLSGKGASPVTEPVSRPSEDLARSLDRSLSLKGVQHIRATGITMPIFYFQPAGLIKTFMEMPRNDWRYVEMEGAPLFETAQRMHLEAASIVASTDRYVIEDGALRHEFVSYDSDSLKLLALKAAIATFSSWTQPH